MKKIVLALALVFTLGLSGVYAQLNYGIKAGLVYNFSAGEMVSDPSQILDIVKNTGDRAGWQMGGFVQLKIPIAGIYIQPELLYTRLNSSYTQKYENGTSEDFSLNFNRLDVPVLFGKKVLGFAHVHAGPVFAFNLSEKLSLSDVSKINSDNMTVGLHAGVGISIGKLIIDARYEGAVSETITQYLPASMTDPVKFDSKPSMVIFSLGYKF